MIHLEAALSQRHSPSELSAAVRAMLGKPLRRASTFAQLAAVGAFACLPEAARAEPCALLWQSTSGPRQETLALLSEIADGGGEPMPYDFLATQPAIAAAQLQPLLPGMCSATHFPLDRVDEAAWTLLLALADTWLTTGRYRRVLCAQLDCLDDAASGHWLSLTAQRTERSAACLKIAHPVGTGNSSALADRPDLPARLAAWLAGNETSIALQSRALPRLTVEFARL